MVNKAKQLVLIVACAMVAACGSGGGGSPSPPSGKLDPAYGTNGSISFMNAGADVLDFVANPDGTVKPIGRVVLRFDASGRPISASTRNGNYYDHSAVLGPDGNIFVARGDFVTGKRFVAEVDQTGNLVTTFGTGGMTSFDSFGGDAGIPDFFADLARDGDGNLYLAGTRYTDLSRSKTMAVAKFDRTGQLVTEFGNAGIALVSLGAHPAELAAVAVDAARNVYLAGNVADNSTGVVAKLDPTGQLAADFGTGGLWSNPSCSGVGDLAIDNAGNLIVAAGCLNAGGQPSASIVKLDARGNLITSFGSSGMRTDALGAGGLGGTVAIGPAGQIYVGGFTWNGRCGSFAVSKLEADGSFAMDFGVAGITTANVSNDRVAKLAFDAQGHLYFGGPVFDCNDTVHGGSIGYAIYRVGA